LGHRGKFRNLRSNSSRAIGDSHGRRNFEVCDYTTSAHTRDLDSTGRYAQQQGHVRDESVGKEVFHGHVHFNRHSGHWNDHKSVKSRSSTSDCHGEKSLLRVSDVCAGWIIEGRVGVLRFYMHEVVVTIITHVHVDDLRILNEKLENHHVILGRGVPTDFPTWRNSSRRDDAVDLSVSPEEVELRVVKAHRAHVILRTVRSNRDVSIIEFSRRDDWLDHLGPGVIPQAIVLMESRLGNAVIHGGHNGRAEI
jgi:hypothetical protein